MKQQSGFTLIELIVVIVILGILAATAMPKYLDIRTDANTAAAAGFAGALSSASLLNKSGCDLTGDIATANKCVPLTVTAAAKCSQIALLLNPSKVIAIGALPNPTVQGALYLAVDTALTQTSLTCAGVYGDGSVAGIAMNYIGQATGP